MYLVLILGISYFTCSVVVFFRDLSQIISILLQVGIWLTPIMWVAEDALAGHPTLARVLKVNPMYYIVSGYRDTFVKKEWFFEHPMWTLYFWIFALLCLLLGGHVFKKLRIHFADVL